MTVEVHAPYGAGVSSNNGWTHLYLISGGTGRFCDAFQWMKINAVGSPPSTAILSGPPTLVAERDVTFLWTGTDDTTPAHQLVYAWRLDGRESQFRAFTNSTGVTYSDLPDGDYTLIVKARDLGGIEERDQDAESWSFTVAANRAPDTPENEYPLAHQAGTSVTPVLIGSDFSDSDGEYTPAKSQFQVRSEGGTYVSPVWDSGEVSPGSTSAEVPQSKALAYNTKYWWRCRYKDNNGAWSPWSGETAFVTQGYPPEIAVFDEGGASITDGQSAVIDLGWGSLGRLGPARTFTVRNDGEEFLVLGLVKVPDGFEVTQPLKTTLDGGETTTFTVQLLTDVEGTFAGDVTFANTDGDESPFSFPVTGIVQMGNQPPTVALANTTTSLAENTNTSARIKVADIVVTDDALGTNMLSLSGADASLFEIDGSVLYLTAGAALDHETNPQLDVTVEVDDTSVGASPDDTASLSVAVTPSTIYVDDDATGGADSGQSWDDAFVNLQDALSFARDSGGAVTEIRVAQGVYKPDLGAGTTHGDPEETFQLINGVAVRGGYAGLGELDSEARDFDLYETVLSGDLSGDDDVGFANYGDNSYCVVKDGENVLLDGFTVTGGNSGGSMGPWEAGGMVNNYSTTKITNCVFKENRGWNGGAMANNAAATVVNCVFFNNWAGQYGAGICCYGSAASAQVTNCTFLENHAAMDGGGIFIWNCSPTIANCIMWGNEAAGETGEYAQISVGNRSPQIDYCCIQGLTGALGGTGNIGDDPLLADPSDGDCHLLPSSPCIDAGDNGPVPADVTTDLDAKPRRLDDPRTPDTGSGAPPIVDMGTFEFMSVNVQPNTPSCSSPADGATAVSLTPTLENSVFSDPDAGDTHQATQWQVDDDSDFSSPVWDYEDTDSDKSTETVPAGLLSDAITYLWRVRHQDNSGAANSWSEWSAPLSFTTVVALPEIEVRGNGVLIADGDTSPSAADHTDFGSVVQGGSAISRTFTVRNDGTATLTLGTVTVPGGYTLTEALSSSLAPGGVDTFTVQLETSTPGTKAGEITFTNNDSDENPFNFQITGVVTGGTEPEITVLGNGVSIADGDTTPDSADHTDFGSVAQGGTALSRVFAVRNDGVALLTLGAVAVPAGYTLTEALSSSLAPGASDSFTVQLDTVTAGTKTGDITFTTNDSDEDPFNFAITGTVDGCIPCDMNWDGFVSIIGDVPWFVQVVYFQDYAGYEQQFPGKDPTLPGDCNGDGILSIIGDVPGFVNRVYFDNHAVALKPNIYLYPEETTELDVRIDFPVGGSVTTSWPAYGDGWHVTAEPSGIIDGQYRYLFYESSQPDYGQYESGWVVAREELETFFRDNLALTGFQGQEIEDFVDYWVPRLSEYPYYAIYPQYNEQIEEAVRLKVSVRPDSLIRLVYAVRGMENGTLTLLAPIIPSFTRSGLVVAEWGVILK